MYMVIIKSTFVILYRECHKININFIILFRGCVNLQKCTRKPLWAIWRHVLALCYIKPVLCIYLIVEILHITCLFRDLQVDYESKPSNLSFWKKLYYFYTAPVIIFAHNVVSIFICNSML